MRIARYTTGDEPAYGVVREHEGRQMIAQVHGDPMYRSLEPTGVVVALDDVRLLAPVIPRSKVIGIGKNYADHAAEMGGEAPKEPLVFLKPNTAVVGPGDPVTLPAISNEVHYEGEPGRRHRPHLQGRAEGAGARGGLRLHRRQRRDPARPAAQRRPVGARQGLRRLVPARPLDRDRARPQRPRRHHAPRRRGRPERPDVADDPRRADPGGTCRRRSRCCPAT
ncbi:hypothetical protein GCM10025868_40080 [Angustibacter aerolatus]|uniref:Fumarylacetoacetase-like C-terminal domain-containing protein n=1 Tax=Angustibacter aerolatus TaxID=1162965 RepID=A0ABQ6JN09_9ACTN|nr:fumarylacetoacetate hydrolase family protein [Angustibacter aerolatus]GMA88758.1 hypothetical protein GCM10025868_40080 [Angustibacter aerolatus]